LYLLKHIVDVFDVFPELNNIGIVINLLESIQKMLRNITNIFDLWFINFIIICLLPTIHHAPIVPASTPPFNLPFYYINTLSFLREDVPLSKYYHPYISTIGAGYATGTLAFHSLTSPYATKSP